MASDRRPKLFTKVPSSSLLQRRSSVYLCECKVFQYLWNITTPLRLSLSRTHLRILHCKCTHVDLANLDDNVRLLQSSSITQQNWDPKYLDSDVWLYALDTQEISSEALNQSVTIANSNLNLGGCLLSSRLRLCRPTILRRSNRINGVRSGLMFLKATLDLIGAVDCSEGAPNELYL